MTGTTHTGAGIDRRGRVEISRGPASEHPSPPAHPTWKPAALGLHEVVARIREPYRRRRPASRLARGTNHRRPPSPRGRTIAAAARKIRQARQASTRKPCAAHLARQTRRSRVAWGRCSRLAIAPNPPAASSAGTASGAANANREAKAAARGTTCIGHPGWSTDSLSNYTNRRRQRHANRRGPQRQAGPAHRAPSPRPGDPAATHCVTSPSYRLLGCSRRPGCVCVKPAARGGATA